MPAPATSLPVPGLIFVFDEFEVDPAAFELRRDGAAVAMEPQVFEVLLALVENAGRVMTKDELFDRVWPERFVTEAALNSRVMSARKALGDSGQKQRYIKTVHGRGYRFVGDVARSGPAAPLGRPAPVPSRQWQGAASQAGTRFIGRRREYTRLLELVQQPACRLVTLVGPGGMGKTRLMSEVADSLAGSLPVDVVMLEHAAPGAMAMEVAAAVGMAAREGDVARQLAAFLGDGPRLLILDNVEHLGDEARELISALLVAGPSVRIACTSRETLRLRQEWVVTLEGMEQEDARELFLERAARANGGTFRADAEAVDRICELTGHLPLAVELAAALTLFVEPAQIAELIATDAACLETDLHDVPLRHRSMMALFEATCARLDDGAKAAMGRLSSFEGGFDAEASATVADVSLSELRALAGRSLLQVRGGRFTMHPLFRQFAQEHAEFERARVRDRHAAYYLDMAGRLAGPLQASGQMEAAELLDAEAGNLMAAWRRAVEAGRADLLKRGMRGMTCYLIFRGRFLEAEALLESAEGAVEVAADPSLLSGLHVALFFVRMRLGRPRDSMAHAQKALSITKEHALPWQPGFAGDARLVATALRMGAADYEGQFRLASECRDLAIAAGDRPGQAFAAWMAGAGLLRMATLRCRQEKDGWVYEPAPDDDKAEASAAYFHEAREILDGYGESWLSAYVAIDFGVHAVSTGDPAAAAGHFRRAYELRERMKDPQGMGSALVYLGDVLSDLGRAEEALEVLDRAEEFSRRASDAAGIADGMRARGIALVGLGRLVEARRVLIEALRRSEAAAYTNNVLGTLRVIAELLIAEGRVEEAVVLLHAVEADPGTTPASKAKSRLSLWELGNPEPEAVFGARTLATSLLQTGGVPLTPLSVAV